jgi:HEAT repeat protein/uncharacterized RDD family membrane protein YckC
MTTPAVQPVTLDELRKLLNSPEEEQRLRGAVELARSRHPRVPELLRQMSAADPSNRVRYTARKLLDVLQQASAPAPGSGSLGDPSPEARARAISALAATGDRTKLPELLGHLPREADPSVVAALVKAIGLLGGPAEVSVLGNFLRDQNPRVRANAVEALGAMGQPVAQALVVPMLQDPDHRVQAAAALVLERMGDESALGVLERMVASKQLWMRDSAAYALSRLENPRAVELLGRLFTDGSAPVRDKAQKGLERFAAAGHAQAARLLGALAHPEPRAASVDEVREVVEDRPPGRDGLEDANPKLRMNIVNTIISEKDTKALPDLIDHLAREENEFVLSRILSAIGILGGAEPVLYGPIVSGYLDNPDSRVVANALDALRLIRASGFDVVVRPLLESPEARVRGNALRYLVVRSQFEPRPHLQEMLESGEPSMQLAALHLIHELERKELGDLPKLAMTSTSVEVRYRLVRLCEELVRKGWPAPKEVLKVLTLDSERAPVELPGQALEVRKPAYVKRMWAWLADSVFLAIVFGLLALAVAVATHPGEIASAQDLKNSFAAQSNVLIVALLYCIVFFVRDGFFEGRGFGKRRMGLRVMDLETRQGCGYIKSMLRQSTFYLPGLNVVELFWPVLDGRGQRLIDKLLDTAVVEERPHELTKLDRAFLWVVFVGPPLAFLAVLVMSALGAGGSR